MTQTLHPGRHGRLVRRASTGADRSAVVVIVLTLPPTAGSSPSTRVRVTSLAGLACREPIRVVVLARSIGATQSGTAPSLADASKSAGSVLVTALLLGKCISPTATRVV